MYHIEQYLEDGEIHISYIIRIFDYYIDKMYLRVRSYEYLYADQPDIVLYKKIDDKITIHINHVIKEKSTVIKEILRIKNA